MWRFIVLIFRSSLLPSGHAWPGQTRARLGAASLIASHFAPGKTEICSLLEFAGFNIKIYSGPLKNFKIIRS